MKKKILFIYGPLGGGGAERVLLDLLSNMDYSTYEVDLCVIVNQGILLTDVPKHVNVIPLWENYSLYYKIAYRLSIWFGINIMFRKVLKEKITKQYFAEISFLEGMPLKLHALMKTKSKKITWVHCDILNFPYEANQFAKGEELKAYNKMDTVVCVSNDALIAFRNRFPACNSDIQMIYNPIDTEKILRLSNEYQLETDGTFTVVTVGRLTPQKKMDRVIRLASRMKQEQIRVRFQIIGDGELKNELLLLRNELDVEDIVEFKGFVKNPFPYIKSADLMFVSSGFEGFGLVVCEAMCLGVPVVSTKTAGPTEIIDENKFGLLCDHDDESIYNTVRMIYEKPELREYYQEKGRERAKMFEVKRTVESLENILNS